MIVGQEANLDCMWPKGPKCRHQTPQSLLYSLGTISIVPSGVQQEHHVHQALGTHWALCDSGLRTLYTLPNGCQGEDVVDARL